MFEPRRRHLIFLFMQVTNCVREARTCRLHPAVDHAIVTPNDTTVRSVRTPNCSCAPTVFPKNEISPRDAIRVTETASLSIRPPGEQTLDRAGEHALNGQYCRLVQLGEQAKRCLALTIPGRCLAEVLRNCRHG